MRVIHWILLGILAMLTAAPLAAEEADDQFAVASGHYEARRWQLATEEFQTFLQKFPRHPNVNLAIFFRGEALLQRGENDPARQLFREYLQREPEGRFARPALFRGGEAAYLAGKNELARPELEQFLQKFPHDRLGAYVLPYLGDIALGRDDFAAAERYFRQGLERFPESRLQDDCRFGLARALEKQQKFDEAQREYRDLARKTSAALADEAQFHLGALQYAREQFAEAVQTFGQLEARWPASNWLPSARLGRSWALLKLNRLDEAESLLADLSKDPQFGVEARYWLGLVRLVKRQWASAAKTLREAAEAAPGHPLCCAMRYHAGEALLHAGDPAGAAEQFACVGAETAPQSEWRDDAARGKVQAALMAEDHAVVERTAAEFEGQFPQSPLRGDVQRMLAQSYLARKDYGRAAALLQSLLAAGAAAGQDAECRYLLAAAYEGQKNYEQALAHVTPVVQSASGGLKANAQLLQGSVLLAMRKFAQAIAPLEAYLSQSAGGDPAVQALGQLAICHARTGRLEEAKKLYAQLRERYPGHRLLAPVTEQLAEAALDARNPAWSAELSSWLAEWGKKSAAATGAVSPNAPAANYEVKGLAGLGWSQFKKGELAEAATTFAQALEKNPPPALAAEVAFVRGQILEKLRQADAALAMYDRVIEHHPSSPQHVEALLAAARLRVRLKQFAPAAARYERLTKDYPQYAKLEAVLYEWAWALVDGNQPSEANRLFERLRKEYPQSRYGTDAAYRLAQSAYEAKDYERAEDLVDQLLAAGPEPRIREFALFLRGQIAVSVKDWVKTETVFSAFVEQFPQSPQRPLAEFWIAEAEYRQEKYDAAGRRFDDLARWLQDRREPWMAMIVLRRAQVLGQQKQWNEALALASRTEQEFPDFQQQYEADYLIGRCRAARAEFEEARKTYLKVIRSPQGAKTETAAMAQWMIGESYFHQENYEAALREFLRLEILYAYPTWQAGALLQAGKCHQRLGQQKEAEKLYTRILEVYPNTPFADQARERLRTSQPPLVGAKR